MAFIFCTNMRLLSFEKVTIIQKCYIYQISEYAQFPCANHKNRQFLLRNDFAREMITTNKW